MCLERRLALCHALLSLREYLNLVFDLPKP